MEYPKKPTLIVHARAAAEPRLVSRSSPPSQNRTYLGKIVAAALRARYALDQFRRAVAHAALLPCSFTEGSKVGLCYPLICAHHHLSGIYTLQDQIRTCGDFL